LAEQLVLRSGTHNVHCIDGTAGEAFGVADGFGVAGGEAVHVALIGYDDIDFAASAVVPLSSIRQPTQALGSTASSSWWRKLKPKALTTGRSSLPRNWWFAKVRARLKVQLALLRVVRRAGAFSRSFSGRLRVAQIPLVRLLNLWDSAGKS
jgi:hypothetical protein